MMTSLEEAGKLDAAGERQIWLMIAAGADIALVNNGLHEADLFQVAGASL